MDGTSLRRFPACFAVTTALLMLLSAVTAPPAGAPGEESRGTTVTDVSPGGDLQAALDAAAPGDTIRLAAGATYVGPFTLPAKEGAATITIRTNASDEDLPPNVRVRPSDATRLAKVVVDRDVPVFTAAPRAHGYQIIGLELSPAPGVYVHNVILLGADETTTADQPYDIAIERCYIHGDPVAGSRRGIALNGRNITVVDSTVSDFKEAGADSQALAGWNGAGPFTIVNNYLEAAGENVMFGGADPKVPGLVPSDIVVRHNYLSKPLTWRIEDPSYAGTPWTVKNLFELKNARRVSVEGNVLERDWTMGQTGTAILFTVRNQDGAAPWASVDHVTFRDNIVRHAGAGISVHGWDDNYPSQQTDRILVANNIFDDLNATTWVGYGAFALVLNGTANITMDHNTVFQSQHVLLSEGLPNTGFVFTNNIAPHNDYGVIGSGRASGNDSLGVYFPDAVFRRNVIPGAPEAFYPVDNYYPASVDDVGFVDLADGNYRLSNASPYKGGATDGRDPGADVDAVEAATCGAVNGTYCQTAGGTNLPGDGDGIPPVAFVFLVAVSSALVAVAALARRRRRRQSPPPCP